MARENSIAPAIDVAEKSFIDVSAARSHFFLLRQQEMLYNKKGRMDDVAFALVRDWRARGMSTTIIANRLNVAVSRAQCLTVLVRGARLLDLSPGSVGDLERMDGFARADDYAHS